MKIKKVIRGKIKSRLKLGNVGFHSIKNLSSSSLTFKNIKIKTQEILILPVVWYGCETLSLIVGEDRRLRAS